MLVKAVLFTYSISVGLLSISPLTDALEFVACYEWAQGSDLSLDCGSEIIWVNSVKHGLSLEHPERFCQSPQVDPINDCFGTYKETEMAVFRGCNMQSQCTTTIPFLSLKEKCNVADNIHASKYLVVNYECVSNTPPNIPMDSYDSSDANQMSGTTLYFTSGNYPDFIRDTNICEVTIKENSVLDITVMELHQKENEPLACAFELIVSDKLNAYRECTEVFWETSMSASNLEYQAHNSDLHIQIAMHTIQPQISANGKAWLQLRTYDASNKNMLTAGFESVQCGSHISLWSTTTLSTNPNTFTTAAATPSSSSSTTSTRQPATATMRDLVTTNSSATTADTFTSTTEDSNGEGAVPRRLKDNTIMPIIAGAAAGGLVLLVIVIIIIILMVRKHKQNNRPPKQLDVIDAWDNQSVIEAAKKSAQTYKMEEPYDMSRSLSPSYPKGDGQNSFRHPMSYSQNNDYAEVPPALPGSKPASEIGISNKGYEKDEYYTGDIDGDHIYSEANNHHKHNTRSLRKKNGGSAMIKDTNSLARVSQMYAKPNKKKKGSPSGFDDPSWAQNGGPNYEFENEAPDSPVADEGIYGYSTTLE